MPDHHQAFEGKTELFQKKIPKKGPKTGSGGMLLLGTISQFFVIFGDSRKSKLKCHEREKGVSPAHMPPAKITKICNGHRTDTHEPFETLGR